ncbi:MAG TPA: NAD(P)/FAD-dependent oxidoreductase [Baekduia sp.]|uniref:phytoene desaturase family protein n=1 Tax=Baekduia sp. TaxID=2600305 RepID=UPI002C9848D5|nr:NAD(P)/FAD-dependent oxidoreductase [Baekduia sp.]HMJ33700.1 NAD(P)/FAD-dependent oxidoreductase [Baekduia sp.]
MTPTHSNHDAVVVGGGHNGLVAAAYLAQAGRSVLLLERRAELGGAAVSEIAFPGVDARVSRYAYLVSLLPRLIVDELGLDLRLVRRRIASYTPDPRAGGRHGLLVDHGDAAATRASFERVTGDGADQAAWEALYAQTARVAERVFPTLTEPLRSREELRAIVGDDEAWTMMFETPLGDTLARTFGDDLVAGVVLTDALIGTFAAARDGDLRQNRCFLYHVIGGGTGDWDVPVGGMGAVSGALARAALGAGAQLRTGAEVLAIDADDEGGAEVRFVEGGGAQRTVRARHVLVNAAPAELDRLRGRVPASEPPEGAQLKVNLLLSRLPRLRDPDVTAEQAFAGTFHVNETAAQLQRAYAEAAAGRIPTLPPCETYCHSLSDPSILGPQLRAAGAQTMTLFGLHMPARLFRGGAAAHDAARAQALAATLRSIDAVLAEPIADCVLRRPDGEPCVEVRTPVDLEDELRLPGGNIFHRDLAWPFAEDGGEVGTWGVETADRCVLLCGAGARRGGGVSGIPGRNAAMAVLGAPVHAALEPDPRFR